ncbi:MULTISPECIES: ComEA family DNA-binding protein [Actinomadura]|uniref:Helix-hairpin-helix domain-containing protein n=1 Tax=Actinomadura miaoliensis TaxID=430685 RepID=A0ABP7VXG5_9ACTN
MPPPGWRPPFPTPPVPPPPPPAGHVPVPVPVETGEPRGILWAFVPFLTFGLGTPFSFLYAAVRRGSWNMGAASIGYGAATAGVLAMMQVGDPLLGFIAGIMMLMLWISGTVHAFAVRPSLFPRSGPRSHVNQHALRVAKYRRTLREEARALAAEDPALAHELRIGRPDLPRTYDDGGLVDVNHASPQALATLPGMTPELVDKIVRRRDEQGGFISAEEMSVDVDLPPGLLPQLAEYAVFLP